MLNLSEIEKTISDLENSDTTFSTCQKLAYLYIVKEHFKNASEPMVTQANEQVKKELNDILPQYRTYCEIKRRYQMHDTTKEAVIIAMGRVCREIEEFIHILYSSTDTEEERQQIKNMMTSLNL